MQLVYDARQMDVVDSGMIFVAVFGLFAFSFGAARAWMKFRQRRKDWKRPLLPVELAMISVMALFPPGYLLFATVETALWHYDYAFHRYVILDGCVKDFDETVQTDHDLGVDSFELEGHRFVLSDSGWRVGYHTSHHHGSPILSGAHLRVYANGSRLLRIELLGSGCVGGSAQAAA